MKNNFFTYSVGDDYFSDGNSIFINFVTEQVTPHLHAHDFIEISYVASGSGVHIMNNREYEVKKGDLFLINYNIPHEFRSLRNSSCQLKVFNCVFKPDFIDVNLSQYKDFADVLHYLSYRSIFPMEFESIEDIKLLGSESSNIENIYEKMLREFTVKDSGFVELLRIYLSELLILIFRELKKDSESEGSTVAKHAKLIEKSIEYLKTNYSTNTRLTDIASKSFLSTTYFCKLFKEHTGITVSEYIQKLRIEEACNKLKNSGDKITAICQDVGYNDIKYFNEVFKKFTGKTPSQYKKDCNR